MIFHLLSATFRVSIRPAALALLLIATALLGACTANTANIDERGLRPHLAVDLQLPEELAPDVAATFRIAVTQGGQPVQAADVTFEFWPEGSPEQKAVVPGSLGDEDGIYSAIHQLSREGVYVVRCLVTAGGLEAMPAKRFALGEEAVLRLAALEEQAAGDTASVGEASGGGHHHH